MCQASGLDALLARVDPGHKSVILVVVSTGYDITILFTSKIGSCGIKGTDNIVLEQDVNII